MNDLAIYDEAAEGWWSGDRRWVRTLQATVPARVTGIDPSAKAITVAVSHASESGLDIAFDVGVGERLPYADDALHAVVCVVVLEHVTDLAAVLAEVARVLRLGGLLLFDTINRTLAARFAVVTLGQTVLGVLPRGTHDPRLFIRPAELRTALTIAGLEPERFVGLGPRGIDRRDDLIFGRVPTCAVIYMGTARRPG